MEQAAVTPLRAWESFYVIVGSSAGALTGLQFVAMTFVADARREGKRTPDVGSAFGTPTLIHFLAVLLVSAILSAPWPALIGASIALSAVGISGVAYSLVTI